MPDDKEVKVAEQVTPSAATDAAGAAGEKKEDTFDGAWTEGAGTSATHEIDAAAAAGKQTEKKDAGEKPPEDGEKAKGKEGEKPPESEPSEKEKKVAEKAEAIEQAEISTFWTAVLAKHPNAERDTDSPEFKKWLEDQPPSTKREASTLDSTTAIAIMDRFYADMKKAGSGQQGQSGPLFPDNFKFKSGDAEIELAAFRKEYGEVADAMLAIAEHIAKARGGSGEDSQLRQQFAKLQAELEDLKRWGAVSTAHSDAMKIRSSGEFQTWMQAQPRAIQHLYGRGSPEDITDILDMYKESVARVAKELADQKAGGIKKKRDDLHRETLRTSGGETLPGKGSDDDFDSAWNEAQRKERERAA